MGRFNGELKPFAFRVVVARSILCDGVALSVVRRCRTYTGVQNVAGTTGKNPGYWIGSPQSSSATCTAPNPNRSGTVVRAVDTIGTRRRLSLTS